MIGCDSFKETKKNSETNSAANEEGIKEKEFEASPQAFEVYAKNNPFIVTIHDTLDLDKLKISRNDLLNYNIYLYVHPLDVDYWYRQSPSIAEEKWTAQANLSLEWSSNNIYSGYLSNREVKNGQGFQIIAVMMKQSLSKTLPEIVQNLEDLTKVKGVHIVSGIRTTIVKKDF